MEDTHHRISAAALRGRDLVTTSGRGPTWRAEITAAGRAYLNDAAKPDAAPPRQSSVSVTQQLVDDVAAAGGSMRVPERPHWERGGVDFRHRAALAERYRKLPAGKRLTVRPAGGGELEISLVDAPGGDLKVTPVPVLEPVSRYHPVVKKFRERSERHEVSRAALPRVSRLLQALVVEAERRGHSVELAADGERQPHRQGEGWTGPKCGHLVVTADGHSTAIRVSEDGLPSRVHWERKNTTYSWGLPGESRSRRPPPSEYEAEATGRVCLHLVSGFGSRPSKWADRKSWTLDEKLPEVLHEIELRAAEDAERKRAAQREAEEREREWEAVKKRAFARHAEAKRADVLRGEVSRWHEVEQIRAYCDAAEARHPDDAGTTEWVRWARRYAEELDPMATAPQTPVPPESVPAEDLRPFMEGWDVFSPARRGW